MNVEYVEYWSHVATIVAAIVATLSIPLSGVLIWWQLNLQTKLARAANGTSLVELSSPFNMALIENKDMARYWVFGLEDYNRTTDKVEMYRYESFVTWWLILHENIFHQRERKLIDKTVYEPWARDLKTFLETKVPKKHWPVIRETFAKEFCDNAEKLAPSLKEAEEQGKKQQETQPTVESGGMSNQ